MEDFKELFTLLIIPMIAIAIVSFGMSFGNPDSKMKLTIVNFIVWFVVYFGFWTFCAWLLSISL